MPELHSLQSLRHRLNTGELTPFELVEQCLDRLEATHPQLLAFLPEFRREERVRRHGTQLEAGFLDSKSRPPLWGIPFGVKDIYHVTGFETRAGSALPGELLTGAEGPAIGRLRDAGGVVLGKTVTTEFAYFEPGPTDNPNAPGHTPGGSSSGSAAAVASGCCPLALGSQTVGSVIRPAAFCGTVGFKTSYGRVSLEGVIPYAPSLDHFGFFVPTAADLQVVLEVMLDKDASEDGPMPERILGVPEAEFLEPMEPAARAIFEQDLDRLRERGWTLRTVPAFDDLAGIVDRHQILACSEMWRVHQPWFPEYGAYYRPRTVQQIRAGQECRDYETTLGAPLALRKSLEWRREAAGIQAWISPSACGPAPAGHSSTGHPAMNLPWTQAGVPVVSVPGTPFPDGRPLGLQLAGRFGGDVALARLATLLEQDLSLVAWGRIVKPPG